MAWSFRRLVRRKPNSIAGLEIGSASSLGTQLALIVSDIVAVVFIDAHPRARSPYGRLSEAAPPRLEATQGSEAQVAPKGPRPPNGLGVVLRPRRAARLHGVARAACLFGDLHRPAPPVLAAVASRHRERHRQCLGIRRDPWLSLLSQGAVHGIPIGSDRRACDGSKPLRGTGHRGKPGTVSRNPWHGREPATAS